jgi:hypothetical protein
MGERGRREKKEGGSEREREKDIKWDVNERDY